MARGSKNGPTSTLLVDEIFSTQNERFVERVRQIANIKYLTALADRWKKDPRPWAREQIFEYLRQPLDCPGHHPVVKRLFKQAEGNGDQHLMAAFLVAFDRLVRRQRRTRYRYDYQTRQSWQDEELFSPRNQILAPAKDRAALNRRASANITNSGSSVVPKNGQLFSYRTRGYLRRRAWRYFRRLGFQRPAEYVPAVAAALVLYRDEDVATGENILDNWSLLHIAFGNSDVLTFKRTSVEVAEGRTLGELAAAPRFEDLWKDPAAASILLKLIVTAQSRLVRVWSIQLLKRHHAVTLQNITVEQLLALLDHPNEEVQHFGAGLLETLAGVDHWPVST